MSRRSSVVLFSLAICLLVPAAGFAQCVDPGETVADNGVHEWVVSAGLVVWGHLCWEGTCTTDPTILQQKPANGGLTTTLLVDTSYDTNRFIGLGADEDGVFYYDADAERVKFHDSAWPTSPPFTLLITAMVPTTRFVSDSTFVFWASQVGVVAAAKNGAAGGQLHTWTGVIDIEVAPSGLYFMTEHLVRRMPRCPSWPWCTDQIEIVLETLAPQENRSMTLLDDTLYIVVHTDHDLIKQVPIDSPSTGSVVYEAPPEVTVGRLACNGEQVFWIEATSYQDVLYRKDLTASPAEPGTPIACSQPGPILTHDPRVFVDDLYVYYRLIGEPLRRLPFDAAPLARDMAVSPYVEVTQVLQSFDLDVPLVAGKPTYVRAWGWTADGPASPGVEARLTGVHSGQPGSTTTPINGTRFLSPVDPGMPDRHGDHAWLFELPSTWTSEGSLELTVEVDPREMYEDLDRTNNTTTVTVEMIERPPACAVFVPVHTHAPKPSLNDRFVPEMFERFRTIWPTHELDAHYQSEMVEELQVCFWDGWLPYPCFGPYELTDDSKWVIAALVTRDTFTDDPDSCESAGARVHYIGMVHPDTDTGTTTGTGNLCLAAAWSKLQSHNTPAWVDWRWPPRGFTLAHEMGHNYHRKHVDCGGADDPDYSYPYSPCSISNTNYDTSTHFGFDPRDHTPIGPTDAADLMAYGDKWVSDWTYKHLAVASEHFSVWDCFWDSICGCHDGICIDCPWQKDAAPSVTYEDLRRPPWAEDLSKQETVILATGVIGPAPTLGELSTLWMYPTADASAGLLRKWERLAAPIMGTSGRDITYSLRLSSVSGVYLDERELVPREVPEPYGSDLHMVFTASFPAPATSVGRVDLVANGTTILDSIETGREAPTVTLQSPHGGETFSTDIPVSWQTYDADGDTSVVSMLQYSPDNGTTWRALTDTVQGVPTSETDMSFSATISLDGVPGSSPSSLVRVIASDGLHTDILTSRSFTVTNRPPKPAILSPVELEQVPAGEPLRLQGSAWDAEDGYLSGGQLQWRLDGGSIGTGEKVVVHGLAPGPYSAELRSTDTAAQLVTASRDLHVAPLSIPEIPSEPNLDGFCNDGQWEQASTVRLPAYPNGYQATVHFARSPDALHLCFTGLNRGSGPVAFAGVRIDVDGSRDDYAQSDDAAFFVSEAGTVYTRSGNGSGGFSEDGPGGLSARASANDVVWSAELRISASQIGGWDHPIGLSFGHYWVASQGNDYVWPYSAVWNRPDTWAMTALGSIPQIGWIAPTAITVGAPGVILDIHGGGFVEDSTAYLSDTALTTLYLNDTELLASVPGSLVTTVGSYHVWVVNPGLTETPSNAKTLTIRNPMPVISNLSPASAVAGDDGFLLGVYGTDIVPGAGVFWNGEPRSASYVQSPQPHLDVALSADDLVSAQSVSVTVANPEPHRGLSEPAAFEITPQLPLLSGRGVMVCESQGAATVTFKLRTQGDRDVTFDVETMDGTAVAPTDYTTKLETLTIPAGHLLASTTVTVIDDDVEEGFESFSVHLDDIVNASVADPDVSVTITDQDGAGALPGDASGDCRFDAQDLAEIVKLIDWPAFRPYGNPDCTQTGDPIESMDLTCVLRQIF